MTITAIGRTAAIAAAAALTIAMPAAAFADPTPDHPPAQDKPAPKAKPILYCVVDHLTGTRIAHKTCKTRDEWIKSEGYDPTK